MFRLSGAKWKQLISSFRLFRKCSLFQAADDPDSLGTKRNSRNVTQKEQPIQYVRNSTHPQKLPSVIGCSFWVTFCTWSYVWCLNCPLQCHQSSVYLIALEVSSMAKIRRSLKGQERRHHPLFPWTVLTVEDVWVCLPEFDLFYASSLQFSLFQDFSDP